MGESGWMDFVANEGDGGGRESGERLGNGEKDKKEGLHKLRKGADQKRRGKHIERYRKG